MGLGAIFIFQLSPYMYLSTQGSLRLDFGGENQLGFPASLRKIDLGIGYDFKIGFSYSLSPKFFWEAHLDGQGHPLKWDAIAGGQSKFSTLTLTLGAAFGVKLGK